MKILSLCRIIYFNHEVYIFDVPLHDWVVKILVIFTTK